MMGGLRALVALALLGGAAMLVVVQCSHHSCSISGSSYDQSCTQSSDCVVEPEGDYCSGECGCAATAINVRAQTQYESDLNDTRGCSGYSPCPASGYPVCVHGTCGIDGSVLWTPPEAGADGGADAGSG
jgi:hypothetical protein